MALKIKDLSFQYQPERSDFVLNDLNLDITMNSNISIVGQSGAGKTTIANLISGVLTPTNGSISSSSKESDIIVVNAKDNIFTGSFLDNISSFSEDIDRDAVINVAKQAKLDSIIQNRENGYDSIISPTSISGGERQRLNLAKALYLKPKVLILDEPLTEVDDITSREILSEISLQENSRTIILLNNKPIVSFKTDSIYYIKEKKLLKAI